MVITILSPPNASLAPQTARSVLIIATVTPVQLVMPATSVTPVQLVILVPTVISVQLVITNLITNARLAAQTAMIVFLTPSV